MSQGCRGKAFWTVVRLIRRFVARQGLRAWIEGMSVSTARIPFPLETWLITLQIPHETTYRYWQQVSLGPHCLMLRPRKPMVLLLGVGLANKNNLPLSNHSLLGSPRAVRCNTQAALSLRMRGQRTSSSSITALLEGQAARKHAVA